MKFDWKELGYFGWWIFAFALYILFLVNTMATLTIMSWLGMPANVVSVVSWAFITVNFSSIIGLSVMAIRILPQKKRTWCD